MKHLNYNNMAGSDNYISFITERERLKDQIKSDLENI